MPILGIEKNNNMLIPITNMSSTSIFETVSFLSNIHNLFIFVSLQCYLLSAVFLARSVCNADKEASF